ncbi:MAG: hypothetical protein WCP30_17080, partial [Mycobacteriaceae bacterium]
MSYEIPHTSSPVHRDETTAAAESSAATYVGRVGALALLLGIGTAAAIAPGIQALKIDEVTVLAGAVTPTSTQTPAYFPTADWLWEPI